MPRMARAISRIAMALSVMLVCAAPVRAQEDERARQVYRDLQEALLRVPRREPQGRARSAHARDADQGRHRAARSSFRTSPTRAGSTCASRTPIPTPRCRRSRPRLADDDIETIRQWIEDGALARSRSKKPCRTIARARRRWRRSKSGRSRRDERAVLGLPCVPCARPVPAVSHAALGRHPDRRVPARAMRAKGLTPSPPRRSPHADPPRLSRPARSAADAGGGRGVRQRSRRPTPGRSSSIGCSPRRTTASAGRGTGSTWCATPIPAASSSTSTAPRPGAIATTSSRRSTTTSRTTSSSASRSPATRSRPASDEAMIATGFLRLGPEGGGGGERGRQDALDDMIVDDVARRSWA